MQYLNIRKANRLLMALALFTGGTQTAFAVGTASGTNINNTATVDYQVGTDARSATGSTTFAVDNRVDLTVTNQDGGNVDVTPGSTGQIQTYTVTNTGNTIQGYILTVVTAASPTTPIPMSNVQIYVDTNNDGIPDAGELYTAGSNARDLNPNGTIGTDDVMQVLVVADTPAAATDGSVDDFRLVAQTTIAGTNTVQGNSGLTPDPDPTVVDVVWADDAGTTSDANRDGQHSDAATYTVTSAALAVVKSVLSTTDEFGGGFAIPGAVVEYQIRVTNSGSSTVNTDTVSVTDQIPANTQLCVTTVGSCTAPSFTDGGTSSGLALNAFEYSNDATATPCEPGDFTYTASPDAITGFDSAITCVRMTTTGDMNGSGGFFDMGITVGIQ